MSIWHSDPPLALIQQMNKVNMLHNVGIEIVEVGPDYIRGTMPVDERTRQPFGILHGGASVVLAESLGSIGANLVLDPGKAYAVGQEVNANHIRSVSSGKVTGTARPVHVGRSSQVWEIRIVDEQEKLVCISRLTMAVVAR
ncbi:MAG: hotdog fold thioesterase [Bacteroidia bacterium]|nr:hotdog fold thioesterase [Bacteroidia bacterium]